jgi:hypothetical protein
MKGGMVTFSKLRSHFLEKKSAIVLLKLLEIFLNQCSKAHISAYLGIIRR